MAALADFLPLLLLFLLSSPFHAQARESHFFNRFTRPNGDIKPEFTEAHAPEKEEPLNFNPFQEAELSKSNPQDPNGYGLYGRSSFDFEDPSAPPTDQNPVFGHGGSSSEDPSATIINPNGGIINAIDNQNGQSATITAPNGHKLHASETKNGVQSVTYDTPSGSKTLTSNEENGGRSVTIGAPNGYGYSFSSSKPTAAYANDEYASSAGNMATIVNSDVQHIIGNVFDNKATEYSNDEYTTALTSKDRVTEDSNNQGNGYGSKQYGMSDTRHMASGKYFFDVVSNNHGQAYKSMMGRGEVYNPANNQYGDGDNKYTIGNTFKNEATEYSNNEYTTGLTSKDHVTEYNNQASGHGNKQYGLSDTRYMSNGKDFYDENSNNHGTAYKSMMGKGQDSRSTNNQYGNDGNKYMVGSSFKNEAAEYSNNEYTTGLTSKDHATEYSNNQANRYGNKQYGLSDTRYMANGKFFYNLNSNNHGKAYNSMMGRGEHFTSTNNEKYGNGENFSSYNASPQGYENLREEDDDDEDGFVP